MYLLYIRYNNIELGPLTFQCSVSNYSLSEMQSLSMLLIVSASFPNPLKDHSQVLGIIWKNRLVYGCQMPIIDMVMLPPPCIACPWSLEQWEKMEEGWCCWHFGVQFPCPITLGIDSVSMISIINLYDLYRDQENPRALGVSPHLALHLEVMSKYQQHSSHSDNPQIAPGNLKDGPGNASHMDWENKGEEGQEMELYLMLLLQVQLCWGKKLISSSCSSSLQSSLPTCMALFLYKSCNHRNYLTRNWKKLCEWTRIWENMVGSMLLC